MNEVDMHEKLECDFCKEIAWVDGRTNQGPWAFMCEVCFLCFGIGIGEGKGQILIYEDDKCN